MQSDDDPVTRIPNGIELPEEMSDESNPLPLYYSMFLVFVEMSSQFSTYVGSLERLAHGLS